jgi:putrescine aminotransferase
MIAQNNNITKELQELDSSHFLHPFTNHKDLLEKKSRVITHAENIYVWDSENNKLLDAMSGLWCVNIGYGQSRMADTAYEQIKKLSFYNSFSGNTNEPAVRLAAKLSALSTTDNCRFQHAFFTNSGSEGNDTAIKLVRRYWDLIGQNNRKIIISRFNSYHGSTIASSSLSGLTALHQQGGMPARLGIDHIQEPNYHALSDPDESLEDFGIRAARWLEDRILHLGADRVAAFIAEPIQATTGVIIPPPSYWPEIQRIVDKYNILLISDEVTCAFGRLGHWFAYEKFGYRPDLITFAKGVTSGYIPLGGVLIRDRIAKTLIDKGGQFLHGHTYSGHPVSCAMALTNIDIIEKEDLPNLVKNDLGLYLDSKMSIFKNHPLVDYVETCGFMSVLVLASSKINNENIGELCADYCINNGLIVKNWEGRIIIAPPLITSKNQIDTIVHMIQRSLDQVFHDIQNLKNI